MQKDNLNPWRKSEIELPEHDCIVECCNDKDSYMDFDMITAEYNGYGFKLFGMYRNPKYWRYAKPLEKRYGKI